MCRVETHTRQTLIFDLPESCPPGIEPLCASDGQTYPSECAMTARGVQKGIKLRKIHTGRCRRLGKDKLCGLVERLKIELGSHLMLLYTAFKILIQKIFENLSLI